MTVTSPCGIDPVEDGTCFGHALTGQALVTDQAATRLAPSGFDPSCVKVITSRDAIIDSIRHFKSQYSQSPGSVAAWMPKKTWGELVAALDVLDPATCSADDVRTVTGQKWSTMLDCDCCGRDVPVLLQIGEEPDYEARWQNICGDCLSYLAQAISTVTAETRQAAQGEAYERGADRHAPSAAQLCPTCGDTSPLDECPDCGAYPSRLNRPQSREGHPQ